jgi:hypothetical protein
MAPYSYYGIAWVTTANHTCSGDQFVGNNYTPNVPGAWQSDTPPNFECVSGGTPTLVSGNNFQMGPNSGDCANSKGAPYHTNWSQNTFTSGPQCSG